MHYYFRNQSTEKSWTHYRSYLDLISKKTVKILHITKRFQYSVILVNKEAIREINRMYRKLDTETDVISFASLDTLSIQVKESSLELGDIFINVDAIRSQAKEYGHSLKREFSFLVAHGLLHLLGYDHMTKQDEVTMFKLQEDILDGIAKR